MSLHALAAATLLGPQVGNSAFRVAMVLANAMNEESGLCCPGVDFLSWKAGMDDRTVRRALDQLTTGGEVERFRRTDPVTRLRTSDGYVLLFAHPDVVAYRTKLDAAFRQERAQRPDFMRENDPSGNFARLAEQQKLTARAILDLVDKIGNRDAQDSLPGENASLPGKNAPPTGQEWEGNQEGNQEVGNDPLTPKGEPASQLAKRIWTQCPKKVRARSSQKLLTDALAVKIKAGDDPESIFQGVLGYLRMDDREEGAFLSAAHRIITQDKFREFMPAPEVQEDGAEFDLWGPVDEVTHGQEAEAGAPSGLDAVPLWKQRAWAQDWKDAPQTWKTHERGPRPGIKGCRISASVLKEFGIGG